MSQKRQLTPREKRFVAEYLVDLDARKAAVRAGYAETSAHNGYKILKRSHVAKAVSRRQRTIREKLEITQERVIEEIAKTAFANLGDFMEVREDGSAVFDLNKMTPEMAAALGEYTVDQYVEGRGKNAQKVKRVRVKLADKLRALEMLCRHLGLFEDSLKLKGEPTLVERIQKGRKRVAEREANG